MLLLGIGRAVPDPIEQAPQRLVTPNTSATEMTWRLQGRREKAARRRYLVTASNTNTTCCATADPVGFFFCWPQRLGGGGGTLQGGNGRGVGVAEVTTANGVSAVPSKIMRLRLCQTTHMSWSAAVCWRSLGGAGWHRRALSDHAGGAGAGGVPERGKRWLMSSIPSRQKGHRSVPKTPWRWRKPCVRVLRVAVAETS
jgi:hypothetical protein